ncbi:hypothetical protein Pan110_06220 [Gimesia panareensis]|nr:hypothetical protein Pan110_06220 [Gimesia panareensis]
MISTVGQADRWHPLINLLIRKVSMMKINFAERRVGVKTDLCPFVAGFCPVLAGILSRFVLVFVPMWPASKGETGRTDSLLSGENSVKIDGDSGVVSSVVPDMQGTEHRPRARARFGPTYDSECANQGESVQVGVREVQCVTGCGDLIGTRQADRWVCFLRKR